MSLIALVNGGFELFERRFTETEDLAANNFARFFLAISGLLVFTHHEKFARMVHTFYLATCEVASLVGVMSVIMILFALFCKEAYGDIAQIRGHQVIPLPHEPYP